MMRLRSVLCILGLLIFSAYAAFAQGQQFKSPFGDNYGPVMQRDVLSDHYPAQRSGIGAGCSIGDHCQPGLCCLQSRDNRRTCQPKAELGAQCSDFQVKGGAYADACPCIQGTCLVTGGRRPVPTGVCVPSQEQRRGSPSQRAQFPSLKQ